MGGYDPGAYGGHWADVYDHFHESRLATDPTVEFLAQLAGSEPVLELGVGTGRVAVPLAERGLEVHGIDAAEAMLARLREKPGGEKIVLTLGDFADVGVDGRFSLIFVVFNTLFSLLTQDDQTRCFTNAAAKLADGGTFVVEAFVPDLGRFDRGQRTQTSELDDDQVVLEASLHSAASQRVRSHHVVLEPGGNRFYPVELRYSWPSELDLMARIAGLSLRKRFGGWRNEPFTDDSQTHVSVYKRA